MPSKKRRKRPPEWPDWFEPKCYPHFDQPIRNPDQVRKLLESPEKIARHAFLPFIHFQKIVRKYKRDSGKFVTKSRPLSYASHKDSLIFRYYCMILALKYEEFLTKVGISETVLAYRRFHPPKCNIHFANDAFGFVERHSPCVAMAFDVKDFFESLDHKLLKKQWMQVLGVSELPADHYAIFKAITRYSWVEREALFNLFGITIQQQACWRGPICTPEQFRDKVRTKEQTKGLIQVKTDCKGVPQGSSISALLSNVYMIPVDVLMVKLATISGGLYFRYSDDILLVCPLEKKTEFETTLREKMKSVNLQLHDGPGKSITAIFTPAGPEALNCDRPLQYLGFTFDGKHVRIRSQTVARYMRRMRKAVRREKYLAKQQAAAGGNPKTRRKSLFRNYSHLGTKNFINYTKKARSIFIKNKIREQIKRHWLHLNAALKIE